MRTVRLFSSRPFAAIVSQCRAKSCFTRSPGESRRSAFFPLDSPWEIAFLVTLVRVSPDSAKIKLKARPDRDLSISSEDILPSAARKKIAARLAEQCRIFATSFFKNEDNRAPSALYRAESLVFYSRPATPDVFHCKLYTVILPRIP